MDLEAELIFTRDHAEQSGAQSLMSATSEDFLKVENQFAKEDERVPRRFSQQKRVLS